MMSTPSMGVFITFILIMRSVCHAKVRFFCGISVLSAWFLLPRGDITIRQVRGHDHVPAPVAGHKGAVCLRGCCRAGLQSPSWHVSAQDKEHQ